MLYGSKDSDDILGRELLRQWADDYPGQFELVEILSDEPVDSLWEGPRGYIDKVMIQKYFPGPNDDSPGKDSFIIFVCGPPPMYDALSGPRDEKEVKGLLGELGYKPDQVYKF